MPHYRNTSFVHFLVSARFFSVWADNYILENNDNIFQPRWRTIDLYFQKSQTQCLLDFHDFHFAGDMYASPTCGLHGRSEWGDYGREDRKHLPDPPSRGREGLGRDMVVPGWYNIPISYSTVQGIAPQTPPGSLSGLARPNHSTPTIFRQGVWTRIGVHLKKFNPITLRFPVFVWIKIYGQYLPVIYVWSWTFWTLLHIWDLWDHMVVGLVVAPDVSGRPIPDHPVLWPCDLLPPGPSLHFLYISTFFLSFWVFSCPPIFNIIGVRNGLSQKDGPSRSWLLTLTHDWLCFSFSFVLINVNFFHNDLLQGGISGCL